MITLRIHKIKANQALLKMMKDKKRTKFLVLFLGISLYLTMWFRNNCFYINDIFIIIHTYLILKKSSNYKNNLIPRMLLHCKSQQFLRLNHCKEFVLFFL